MVWHVDKYKITFSYQFQENLSWLSIIDVRTRYRAAARQLRNTVLHNRQVHYNFHHSLTDLIALAHPPSVLTYILH